MPQRENQEFEDQFPDLRRSFTFVHEVTGCYVTPWDHVTGETDLGLFDDPRWSEPAKWQVVKDDSTGAYRIKSDSGQFWVVTKKYEAVRAWKDYKNDSYETDLWDFVPIYGNGSNTPHFAFQPHTLQEFGLGPAENLMRRAVHLWPLRLHADSPRLAHDFLFTQV